MIATAGPCHGYRATAILLMRLYFSCLLIVFLLASPTAFAESMLAPQPAAQAWLLVDYHSGRVLAEHHADQRREPASLTKLMTAYVLFKQLQTRKLDLDAKALISAQAWGMPGTRMYTRLNDRVRVEDLIKGMVVQSGNDATMALMEHAAGSQANFVQWMNAEAVRLGMNATHFTNGTGLIQADHYSSARDLYRLTVALIHDFPEYYQRWYGLKEFSYAGLTQYNRNTLLSRVPGADGVKTGHTRNAGFCLVGSAVRANMRLVVIVLGAADEAARGDAGASLLEFGFREYETRLLYQAQMPAINVHVWMGHLDTLPAGLGQDVYLTLARGDFHKLQANVVVDHAPTAPIKQGEAIGRVALVLDNKPIGNYALLALRDVDQGNVVQRALDQVHMWLQ